MVLDMGLAGDSERAKEIAREGLVNAESLTFAWAKAISLSSLAFALSQLGERELAGEAFLKALRAAWDVGDNDDRAYALSAVASAMKQAGDERAESVFRDAVSQFYAMGMPPEEIEYEFRNIYIDYRAESGWDVESLFAVALEINDTSERLRATSKVAESVARALLCGMYPSKARGEVDVDRLCDRSKFQAIVSEEEDLLNTQQKTSLLCRLCDAIRGRSE
jgi:tetratricopeptide (TPR) repeat protein